MLNPRCVALSKITLEELELFWNQLAGEKEYLSNLLQSNLQFVAGIEQNNKIVGIVGLKGYLRIFHFVFVVVKREFQRKGLGAALFNEVFTYARSQSYPVIFASGNQKNTASLRLLYKEGFKNVYRSDSYCRLAIPLNLFGEIMVKILPVIFACYSLIQKVSMRFKLIKTWGS